MKSAPQARALTLYAISVVRLDHWPAPGDKLKNQRDYGQYQQNVNEPSKRIAAYYTQQPQDQKDYKKRPQHV